MPKSQCSLPFCDKCFDDYLSGVGSAAWEWAKIDQLCSHCQKPATHSVWRTQEEVLIEIGREMILKMDDIKSLLDSINERLK